MKASLYDSEGNSKESIELPNVFNSSIRHDIVAKYVEADREWQPWALDRRAGRKHSASGTISHKRHDWKGQYGKGIARTPRKAMWRRGSQFYWVGAEVSNTRGGRRPNGPKGILPSAKINKKEQMIAFASAFAATARPELVSKRYASFADKKLAVPFVVHVDKDTKAKQIVMLMEKLVGTDHAFNHISIRSGHGSMRGKTRKQSAGILLVMGDKEIVKSSALEVKKLSDVRIADLYPLGRIVMYTKQAVTEIGTWF